MNLLRELFLAQFVEGEELSRKNDILDETDARQFDANDDLNSVTATKLLKKETNLRAGREPS